MSGNTANNEPATNLVVGKRGAWIDLKIVFKPNAEGTVFEKADYYVTVDAYNESGVTKGVEIVKVPTRA